MTNKYNTTLYIGVTNNLERRIIEHKEGLIPSFTSRYNLTKLVYFEGYSSISQAIEREKQLKGWKREWKDSLIEMMNPNWEDLLGSGISEADSGSSPD